MNNKKNFIDIIKQIPFYKQNEIEDIQKNSSNASVNTNANVTTKSIVKTDNKSKAKNNKKSKQSTKLNVTEISNTGNKSTSNIDNKCIDDKNVNHIDVDIDVDIDNDNEDILKGLYSKYLESKFYETCEKSDTNELYLYDELIIKENHFSNSINTNTNIKTNTDNKNEKRVNRKTDTTVNDFTINNLKIKLQESFSIRSRLKGINRPSKCVVKEGHFLKNKRLNIQESEDSKRTYSDIEYSTSNVKYTENYSNSQIFYDDNKLNDYSSNNLNLNLTAKFNENNITNITNTELNENKNDFKGETSFQYTQYDFSLKRDTNILPLTNTENIVHIEQEKQKRISKFNLSPENNFSTYDSINNFNSLNNVNYRFDNLLNQESNNINTTNINAIDTNNNNNNNEELNLSATKITQQKLVRSKINTIDNNVETSNTNNKKNSIKSKKIITEINSNVNKISTKKKSKPGKFPKTIVIDKEQSSIIYSSKGKSSENVSKIKFLFVVLDKEDNKIIKSNLSKILKIKDFKSKKPEINLKTHLLLKEEGIPASYVEYNFVNILVDAIIPNEVKAKKFLIRKIKKSIFSSFNFDFSAIIEFY